MLNIKEFEKLEREPNKIYTLELEKSGFRILIGVYSSIKTCSEAIRIIPKQGYEIFKIQEMTLDEKPISPIEKVFTVRCDI